MAYLLDTHVVLWHVSKNNNLSPRAKAIVDSKTTIFFSIASLWEIAIKVNIGKLQIDCSFDDLLDRIAVMRAMIIPIEIQSLKNYLGLPYLRAHRDPFDRILIAQALEYELKIVSCDEKFDAYPIQRIWE